MRFRNNTWIILILLALFIIFIPNTYAAMIIRYEEMPIFIILIITATTIMNIIVEFIIVYIFLKSRDLVKKDVFLSVALVNFVFFPPTQTIAYFLTLFNIELYVFYVVIFGFLMVLLEWLLYRLEFQKLYLKKSIQESLSLKKTILISTMANIASFSVIYLIPVIIMIQQYLLYLDLFSSAIFIDISILFFT